MARLLAIRLIKDNKVITVAIIVTIALASMMFFLSLIYSQVVQDEFISNMPYEAENADIEIVYQSSSETRIITTTPLDDYQEYIDYSVGVLNLYGTTTIKGNIHYIDLKGVSEEGFNRINDYEFIESIGRNLREDEVIISRWTSEELGLGLDSQLSINVNGRNQTFYVAKIVEDHPSFEQIGAHVVYAMDNYVSKYMGHPLGGIYNKIFIQSSEHITATELIDMLDEIEEYSDYKISESNNLEDIYTNVRDISLPVTIGTSLCAVLALLLVYMIITTSYRKRVNLISQLKANGATNGFITKVSLIEGSIYTLGGVIIGLIINALLLLVFLPKFLNINIDSFYNIRLLLSSLLCALVALIMIIAPIIKLRKVSVRKAQIASSQNMWEPKLYTLIISISLIILSVVLLVFSKYLNYSRGIVALAASFVGFIMLLPYLLRLVLWIARRFDSKIKGALHIAIINLKSEKSIVNNARILMLGILICSIIFSAVNISKDLGYQLIDQLDCDIIIQNVRGDTLTHVDMIDNIDGVYDVYSYKFDKARVESINYDVNVIGLDPENITLMGEFEVITPLSVVIDSLSSGDNIVIDYMYHKVYKINQGDTIPITINDITHNLRVGGFYSSYQYGGRTAMINNELLSELYNVSPYDTIILKTEHNIDDTVMNIRSIMGTYNLVVLNKHSAFDLYFNLIDDAIVFSYYFVSLIILVCFASVFTNIINARELRKRVRLQMITLGLNKNKLVLIQLIENAISGLIVLLLSSSMLIIINLSISNILSISSIYVAKIVSLSVLIFISLLYLTVYAAMSLFGKYDKNINVTIK